MAVTKKYISENPQLIEEWNWEKNIEFDPSRLTVGSHKIVWWNCSKGHEWQATIKDRNHGNGCPYCASKKVLKGYNDLQTVNPILAKEWDYEKNNGLTPADVMPNSSKKVWWKCNKGHEWQVRVADRNNGRGCPYCFGRYVINGKTDLQTVNPNLAEEWDYEKNDGLTPMDITPNSHKKVWWKCARGHEWQASIVNRNKGNGCPYCSGIYVIKGENDLQTVNPNLAEEWNYGRNSELTPKDVLPNSNKKIWWKCAKGHEWQASINDRNKGNGCPFCSGRYAIKGENDLQTVNPTLAKEWNYEKNGGLTPADIMPNSDKKVWWKCSKGHMWQASIGNRNKGNGCPICNSERKTSFPEYAIVFYLKKHGLKVLHSYKDNGYELDIYIPSKKIAIEYDGSFWHKNKIKKDLEKNHKCQDDGITLYRIRDGLPTLNDSSLDFIIQQTEKDLPVILKKVLSDIIGTNIDVDLKRDSIAIENLREFTEKENSLMFSNPKIAHEWNYEKNGNLKPEHFMANSNKRVWWKCVSGHEWIAMINDRNSGKGCPFCAGKKVLKGYNDLQTVNPTLAKEWNFEKNKEFTPIDVTSGCSKKVWWKCVKGHEWQASIASRNNGNGCPYCAGNKVLRGYNDLQTLNPTLAKEWNYEKNKNLKPEDFTANSGQKVWWNCSKGHEWQTTIDSRNRGRDCPYCTGKKVLKGYNDLQTINPTLAKEWNYEKNIGITPADITPGSDKKVWWQCSKGHEWQATVDKRNKGRGCPQCAREKRKVTSQK